MVGIVRIKKQHQPFLVDVVVSDNGFILHFSNEVKAEKAMAPHSSTLAWKIPWTEEPGRLQSMGSLGVEHD